MDDTHLTASREVGDPPEAGAPSGPVASTGCIVAVLALVLGALVVFPALLWGAGIACGAH